MNNHPTVTTTISMDQKCNQCNQMGATPGGRCMDCITRGVQRGEYDHIFKPAGERLRNMSTQVNESHNQTNRDIRMYPVPEDSSFTEAEDEFIAAPELEDLFEELCQKYGDFNHLNHEIGDRAFTMTMKWKRKGGESGGKAVFGKCIRVTGLLKHYVRTHYVIWIAADNTRGRLNYHQMKALMFHEMLHTWVGDKGEPALVAHDFEGFVREIEEFGTWRKDIEPLALAFAGVDEQDSLFQ